MDEISIAIQFDASWNTLGMNYGCYVGGALCVVDAVSSIAQSTRQLGVRHFDARSSNATRCCYRRCRATGGGDHLCRLSHDCCFRACKITTKGF